MNESELGSERRCNHCEQLTAYRLSLPLVLLVLAFSVLACSPSSTPIPTPTPTLTPISGTEESLVICICGILIPSGIIVFILGHWYAKHAKQKRAEREILNLQVEHQRKVQQQIAEQQREIENLKAEHQRRIEELEATYQREIEGLLSEKADRLRTIEMQWWFQCLEKHRWRKNTPEVEVEVKLVFLLLRYLGFLESEMELRVPIRLTEGSREMAIEADWVIQSDNFGALVVVEVKAPQKKLDRTVQNQARSYAFHLGAPVYIVTNGEHVQIFHREVLKDRCVVSCSTTRLGENWELIQQAAGKSNVISLKRQLSSQAKAER